MITLINKRILTIVDILLKQDTYITIDKISETLQVSNKTIRNDLLLVGEWLQDNHLQLIKKTGVGIKIDGEREQKLHIIASIQERNKAAVDFSPQSRMIYIGMQLAIFDQCRIFELASSLYVSRATIHKDILSLINEIEQFHVEINRKNNNGISLQGKEKNVRNALLHLMLHDNGYHNFIKMVQRSNHPCDGSLIFPGLEVSDDEMKDFIDCILSSNMHYIKSLNFQSLALLILRCFTAYLRIQDGHIIHLSDTFLSELKKEPLYDEARALSDRIANHYHFTYPEIEIRYLQVYCLALQNTDDLSENDKHLAQDFTNSLIASWSKQLHLSFEKDKVLYRHLYEHLCPAIIRFRHGIPNENPMIDEIHQLYENTFSVVKNSISCIESYFSITLSENEIGYLALHLAAAMEQMKKPLSTILVCHNGIGAAELAYAKLHAQLPEIHIISKETFFSIYHIDLHDIDLIISTIPLKLPTRIPIIQINSILHEYDFIRLKESVIQLYKEKNNPLNHKMAQCD